jgi:hypothetical protein
MAVAKPPAIDAALAAELRAVRALVEALPLDPHIRTAPAAAVILERLLFLVEHLARRIEQIDPATDTA